MHQGPGIRAWEHKIFTRAAAACVLSTQYDVSLWVVHVARVSACSVLPSQENEEDGRVGTSPMLLARRGRATNQISASVLLAGAAAEVPGEAGKLARDRSTTALE